MMLYESSCETNLSVDEMCARLDAVVCSVLSQVEHYQEHIADLRRSALPSQHEEPKLVRGAALAGAHSLLDTVTDLSRELESLKAVVQEQKKSLEILRNRSLMDWLTGLMNRQCFEDELARRIADTRRTGRPLGCVFIDIDHFKRVNDSLGHAAGDKALCGIANLLRNSLREIDTIARYGGEEFVALLPGAALAGACRVAERIRQLVRGSVFPYDDYEISVTISVGVAAIDAKTARGPGDIGAQLLKQADDALYAAKRAGRNSVYVSLDGKTQALRPQRKVDRPPNQRPEQRRWVRLPPSQTDIRLRLPNAAWQTAAVLDESIAGVAVRTDAMMQWSVSDTVELEVFGEVRKATLVNVVASETGGHRLGLRWTDLE